MMLTKRWRVRPSWSAALLVLVVAVPMLALTACGSSSKSTPPSNASASGGSASSGGGSGLKPINSGQLTVGMNLQFKPEMYLQNGQPAGYDVDLLNQLAPAVNEKLNIQNLDFNGLIPGLQSNKFDLVSVGLSATPARKQVVDFTRAYVPYAQVLAVSAKNAASVTSVSQLNQSGKTIVALQGSTAEQLAKKLFPKATVTGFADQNAAFLQVATGRANGIVVEDYLLAQYQASNKNQLAKAAIGKPLDVQYGSWALPKGNTAFVNYLDTWLCARQKDGTMAKLYKQDFQVSDMPPMPAC